MTDEARKQAEVDYPIAIGEEGQRWLQTKPFANEPRETARLLIDFGYVVQLLDLRPGMSLVELGCGPGWMTRFAARHGLEAAGYDIAPKMIEIAREVAAAEGVDATFEVGDMETLDLGHRYDTALVYDAVHHTPRADLVFAAAHRALKPGGRLLLAEPNWKHRYQGRSASERVRRHRARLHAAPLQEAPARGGVRRHPALPQQPQAALRELAEGLPVAPRRADRLPRARRLLDANLAPRRR